MESIEVRNIMKSKRRGTYFYCVWKTEKGGALKISRGVVRILNNEVKTSKKGADYVSLFVTNNWKHMPKVTYFLEGVEVSQEEYERVVPKQNKEITICFSKHVEDIIELR